LCGGTVVGVVAVLHFFVGPIAPRQPIEESIAECSRLMSATPSPPNWLVRLRADGAPNGQGWDADRIVDLGTVAVGLVAILLAVASFIRREEICAWPVAPSRWAEEQSRFSL